MIGYLYNRQSQTEDAISLMAKVESLEERVINCIMLS